MSEQKIIQYKEDNYEFLIAFLAGAKYKASPIIISVLLTNSFV